MKNSAGKGGDETAIRVASRDENFLSISYVENLREKSKKKKNISLFFSSLCVSLLFFSILFFCLIYTCLENCLNCANKKI